MQNLEEIADQLAGVFYLATVDGDQPHVRPFDGAAVVDERLYIGTTKNKKIFKQIEKQPKVEICAMGDFGMLRFSAEAYPEDDDLTEDIFDEIGKNYTPDSVALRLENIKIIK